MVKKEGYKGERERVFLLKTLYFETKKIQKDSTIKQQEELCQ